jgi:hypothetical protein
MKAVRREGQRVMALAGVAIVAAGLVAVGTTARAGQFRGDATVADNVLSGVTCSSGTVCWAVGSSEARDVTRNQVLRFNGRRWSPVPVPNPGGSGPDASSELSAVKCASASDCWAVGEFGKSHASLTQALHWNGRTWSRVAAPDPGGTHHGDFNDLSSVACVSAANCWADGVYGHPVGRNDVQLNLVLHWSGRRWSQARVPNPGGIKAGDVSALSAIRCPSAADCWAAGTSGQATTDGTFDNEVLHWNGKKWVTVTVPSPGKPDNDRTENGLDGLSCPPGGHCWAVGSDSAPSGSLDESLHWNGRGWHTAPTPDPASGTDDSDDLAGVSCTADTNCWAVGDDNNGSTYLNEVLHWTGRTWLVVSVPDPGGSAAGDDNFLVADVCASAKDCWAVGDTEKQGGPEVNQILHWAGKKWAIAS